MTRLIVAALIALAAASALADTKVTAPPTEVAIIHYDKLSEAKLEGTVKDVTFEPVLGSAKETPCLQFTNQQYKLRQIILRVLGLTASDYDVYMDTNMDGTRKKTTVFAIPGDPPPDPHMSDYFVGSMPKEKLEAGIAIPLSGSAISAANRDYYARLSARVEAAIKRYPSESSINDLKICCAALNGTVNWIANQDGGDLDLRTIHVVLAPKGLPFSIERGAINVPGDPRYKNESTLGDNLQILRKNVHDMVESPMSRNDALQALTPIDFNLTVGKANATTGKRMVNAMIRNWTDRPVTGKIVLYAPDGWRVKVVSDTIKTTGYGKSTAASFAAFPPKAPKTGERFSATAYLMVGGVEIQFVAETSL